MFPFLIGKVLTTITRAFKVEYNFDGIVFPFLIGKVLKPAFKPL